MTHPSDFLYRQNDEERLTKREYFAASAMQALLSRSSLSGFTPQQYAQGGLQYADALIEELNKQHKDGKESK